MRKKQKSPAIVKHSVVLQFESERCCYTKAPFLSLNRKSGSGQKILFSISLFILNKGLDLAKRPLISFYADQGNVRKKNSPFMGIFVRLTDACYLVSLVQILHRTKCNTCSQEIIFTAVEQFADFQRSEQ